MRVCDFCVLLLICKVQGEVDNYVRDDASKKDLKIIDDILSEKENEKFIHSIQQDKKADDIKNDKQVAEIHKDTFKAIEMLHVTDHVEYEGNMGETAQKYINDELVSIGKWLQTEIKEGKRRNSKCWVWCNDMKNWWKAAEKMLRYQEKWIDYITGFSGSCDVFKEGIQPDIDAIKVVKSCWGMGCKDSTEYNRIHQEMARRLQIIVNSPYITDMPTAAPIPAPSAAPTQATSTSPSSSSRNCEDLVSSGKCEYFKGKGLCVLSSYIRMCMKTCGVCSVYKKTDHEGFQRAL
jgi:hypothetical protein